MGIQIPESLSFEISVGLPFINGMVIYSLGHIARIGAGDKILIHAAAGVVGQTQGSRVKGGEVFVTLSV